MASMEAKRVQYPIGQGGFHHTLVFDGSERFSIVMDCGGGTKQHRRRLADCFVEASGRNHDAIAISHLDKDHIDGIPILHDAGARFDAVFLPHVDVASYMQWMTLRLCGSREVGAAEVGAALATTSGLYGGQFGTPIMISSGPPDTNRPMEEAIVRRGKMQDRLGELHALGNPVPNHEASVRSGTLDWIFRFYALEWTMPTVAAAIWKVNALGPLKLAIDQLSQGQPTAAQIAAIDNELKAKIAATDANLAMSSICGKSPFKTDPSAKVLLGKLYEASPGLVDYNDASLCVYSGPSLANGQSPSTRFSVIRKSAMDLRSEKCTRCVGWLHTGDAQFGNLSSLNTFFAHFVAELPFLSTLVLPHHGSRHSYSTSLTELTAFSLAATNPLLFIAASEPLGRYHHPHIPVMRKCESLGRLVIVDSNFHSLHFDIAHGYRDNLHALLEFFV